jgi:hypothetical protein
MADRWPLTMNRTEAAAFLGVSPSLFDKIVKENRVPSFQWTPRGDRYYHRLALEGVAEARARLPVDPRAA